MGGNVSSPLTAIAGPGEQIRVFTRDSTQQVKMIAWRGGDIRNWESWVSLEGDTAAPRHVAQEGGSEGLSGVELVDDAGAVGARDHEP